MRWTKLFCLECGGYKLTELKRTKDEEKKQEIFQFECDKCRAWIYIVIGVHPKMSCLDIYSNRCPSEIEGKGTWD